MTLPQGTTGSDFEAILGFSFIAMLVLGVILVRVVILRGVSRLMLAKSETVDGQPIPGSDVPEHKAEHKPRLLEIDGISDQQDIVNTREQFVARARSSFRTAYLVDFLGCLGYVVIPLLFVFVAGYSPTPEPMWASGGLTIFYFLFISSGRFLLFRKQFRALDFKLGLRWESPVITVWRGILAPKNDGYVMGAFVAIVALMAFTTFMDDPGADIDWHYPMVGVGMLLAVVLHIGMKYGFWRRAQEDRNVKLVLLRVFGLDDTVRFTFGGILRFWEHFGSYFTVVDPAYMKHHLRFWSWRSLITMIGVAVLWFIGAVVATMIFGTAGREFDRVFNYVALPVAVLALGVFSGGFYWMVRRSFARNLADIQSRMSRLLRRPRNIGLGFRALPLACFDNTWRLAVREFLTRGDVVLMDLRGYSSERKGCEYEVDFLFDNIDIRRVVFLVDTESDRRAVHQLIEDRWEYLRANSPNRTATDPVARIYVSAEKKKEDMQGLLDTLLSVA